MSAAKEEVVLDTNVAVVSNGDTEQAGWDCVANCVAATRRVTDSQILLVDELGLILHEYSRNLNRSGQPGVGDAFFRFIWDNQANERHCRKVAVTPNAERGFDEFPDDPRLSNFDRDDRKFVAVAIASGSAPKILNASDTDWWIHRQELERHGVAIEFLCPDLMERPRPPSP